MLSLLYPPPVAMTDRQTQSPCPSPALPYTLLLIISPEITETDDLPQRTNYHIIIVIVITSPRIRFRSCALPLCQFRVSDAFCPYHTKYITTFRSPKIYKSGACWWTHRNDRQPRERSVWVFASDKRFLALPIEETKIWTWGDTQYVVLE